MESNLLNMPETRSKPQTGEGKGLSKEMKRRIEWILILILLFGYVLVSFSQNGLEEINFKAQSTFSPTIKDAFKFADLPEIKDSVKRIQNIQYGITSSPLFPKYEVQPINPAKMQNEPLQKLYKSLLKVGYGPIYNMPYGEFWISNTRNKDKSYGAHLKHLSGTPHLADVGYGGYSDNQASVFGKQFYKKHTLSGEFNYVRNVVHYYGYDTTINKLSDDYTKQRYQLFEPKLRLQSHYTDSTHINHDLNLSFYNLQNLNRTNESNVKLNAFGSLFVSKEKFNIGFLADFYNQKQSKDTVNDLIVTVNPSFEAHGEKWHADMGLSATLDNFDKTRFYFYPQLNVHYNVYENIIIPYAGVTGGLQKNSFRSLSTENSFVDSSLRYANTNNKYNAFIGLKGNLSAKTSYDAKVSYAQYDSMHFFVIDYSKNIQLNNRFKVIYGNTTLLTVSGQLKHQVNEKINILAKGNYYVYTPANPLVRAYHKPDYDLTLSGIYNLQSKFILRADIFVVGNQWALSKANDGTNTLAPKQLNGYVDANLEVEYRYSKMLSFFARANNIANQRYYRWEKYPSQRFNFMLGLTFVPF